MFPELELDRLKGFKLLLFLLIPGELKGDPVFRRGNPIPFPGAEGSSLNIPRNDPEPLLFRLATGLLSATMAEDENPEPPSPNA